VVFVLRTIPEFSAAFVVDGDIVELRPTTPTMVFRYVIGLLPAHDELAIAPDAGDHSWS
jgi:hypothetical protein